MKQPKLKDLKIDIEGTLAMRKAMKEMKATGKSSGAKVTFRKKGKKKGARTRPAK